LKEDDVFQLATDKATNQVLMIGIVFLVAGLVALFIVKQPTPLFVLGILYVSTPFLPDRSNTIHQARIPQINLSGVVMPKFRIALFLVALVLVATACSVTTTIPSTPTPGSPAQVTSASEQSKAPQPPPATKAPQPKQPGGNPPPSPTTAVLFSSKSSVASITPQLSQAKTSTAFPGMMLIPAGEFEMGDHHNFVDPQHPSDEVPIHTVHIDSFYMSATETTNQQYVEYLNAALAQGSIEVRNGIVYGKGGSEIYLTTRQADEYSRINWDSRTFTVLDNRGNHPVTSVRWFGAAAYTNWLSAKNGLEGCYNLTTGKCDFTKKSFRLPTEAEWEYAARGGRYNPYTIFPWGDDADNAKANWPDSGDPYEVGTFPWTTPVGFYNGELRRKTDFNWPGKQETYQTKNSVNGFGLYDVAGNVWEFVYDWYGREYYRASPSSNPQGPDKGDPMPDGKLYRGMRGGNWYNGENGHARVANRNPSYFRGPQDPNHPYYHIGMRVALDLHGEIR
jgi:formylglycine-generating enzyme required for sulfatase activity